MPIQCGPAISQQQRLPGNINSSSSGYYKLRIPSPAFSRVHVIRPVTSHRFRDSWSILNMRFVYITAMNILNTHVIIVGCMNGSLDSLSDHARCVVLRTCPCRD